MKKFLCLLSALLLNTSAAISQTENKSTASDAEREYMRMVLSRIENNWEPLMFALVYRDSCVTAQETINGAKEKHFAEMSIVPMVSFSVQRSGEITDLKIIRASGFVPVDLSCEDSILGLSPLPKVPKEMETPFQMVCDFYQPSLGTDSGLSVLIEHNDNSTKRESPSLSSRFGIDADGVSATWFFHSIPIDATRRYPGVISRENIQSEQNSRRLRITNAEAQLQNIRKEWTGFFRKHPTATQEELLEQRDKIDKAFDSYSGGRAELSARTIK